MLPISIKRSANPRLVYANGVSINTYIIHAMIVMIKSNNFIESIKLVREHTDGCLGLREAKAVADAVRDSVEGRVPSYTLEDSINLLVV